MEPKKGKEKRKEGKHSSRHLNLTFDSPFSLSSLLALYLSISLSFSLSDLVFFSLLFLYIDGAKQHFHAAAGIEGGLVLFAVLQKDRQQLAAVELVLVKLFGLRNKREKTEET